jgi:tetratricopeptide (TPR) repeat protein
MFDDEDDDSGERFLKEDLEQFESYLEGVQIGFMDSDRIEAIVDHYLINGNFSKAKSAAEFALVHFSYNHLFHLRKAQALSGLGKLHEALDIIDGIDNFGMLSFEYFLTKAALFSQLKDSKNAIKNYNLAIDEAAGEDLDDIYLDIAMEYQNLGNFKEAISILKTALMVNSENEGALYEIAFCYDQLGDYSLAIECYTQFIDENPYSFTAWYNLGNAYSKIENYEKALWAYDYSILINSNFGPAHFNLANAFLSQEKFFKAIEHFNECMRIDGDDATAYCYIGECYEQLNELELSKHNYKRSLELAPMLSEAWLGLGIIEDLEGKTNEGIILIEKALEFDPQNAGIMHVLAGAYEKIEDFDQAASFYKQSLEINPNDEECLSDYIELLTESSPQEAFVVLKEFMDKHDGNKISSILEVNLFWLLGQREEALHLFSKCLKENGNKAKTIFDINPNLLDDQDFLNISQD